jgi:hypothetical protein
MLTSAAVDVELPCEVVLVVLLPAVDVFDVMLAGAIVPLGYVTVPLVGGGVPTQKGKPPQRHGLFLQQRQGWQVQVSTCAYTQ